jgi:outer membrane protein OmpA-like peptidoglycan-associated protein
MLAGFSYLGEIIPKLVSVKIIFPAFLVLFLWSNSFGQTSPPTYYVTIGVFAVKNNAIRYTDQATRNNFDAHYALNPLKNFYYVYIFSTTDRKKAFAFTIKTRVETEYKQAWVFIGNLGDEPPVVEKKPEPVKPPEEKPVEPVVVKKDSVLVVPAVAKIDSSTIPKPIEKPVEKKPVVKHEGKPFYFKLLSVETGKEITGEVRVQESVKATQYQAFKANEIVYIKAPINSDGTYTVVTNAPGFEQMRMTLTYKEPEGTKGADDEFIVPIELKKAKAGDYIDFNNVKFVRNSSIMNPGSQDELDGLVALMKENTKYKIKIHGHCNGRQNREIIVLGKSPNFFAMDAKNNIKETTSAKVLSDERAKAVKGYLVSQGIGAERIATKAEGGKIPLYPEGSTLASYNDRVEIEVKKD